MVVVVCFDIVDIVTALACSSEFELAVVFAFAYCSSDVVVVFVLRGAHVRGVVVAVTAAAASARQTSATTTTCRDATSLRKYCDVTTLPTPWRSSGTHSCAMTSYRQQVRAGTVTRVFAWQVVACELFRR